MINTIAQVALAAGKFDPSEPVGRIRAFLILVLSVLMIVVSAYAVVAAGRRGNNAKAFNITSATVIALIPAAIGVGIGAVAFGAAVLGWAIPGLSP